MDNDNCDENDRYHSDPYQLDPEDDPNNYWYQPWRRRLIVLFIMKAVNQNNSFKGWLIYNLYNLSFGLDALVPSM